MSDPIFTTIANLKGERGRTGPKGDPGVNAVENDEAVGAYIDSDGTDSRAAVKRAYTSPRMQQFIDQAGVANRLTLWHEAKPDYTARRLNVAVIGDSIVQGQGATTFDQRWTNVANRQLRRKLGLPTGGPGFISPKRTGSLSSYTYPSQVSGTTTESATYGATRNSQQVSTSLTGVITLGPITSTSADVIFTKYVGATRSFETRVDGGSWVNHNDAAGGSDFTPGQKINIPFGASGSHTLEIRGSSTSGVTIEGFNVYNGDEDAGIAVHALGYHGWTVADWISGTNRYWPLSIEDGIEPDLIAIALGANDNFTGVAPATFQSSLDSMIDTIRTNSGASTPLLVVAYPESARTNHEEWPDFVDAMRAVVAAKTRTAMLDLTLEMTRVGDDTLSLWDDSVHPSNNGHLVIGQLFADAIA